MPGPACKEEQAGKDETSGIASLSRAVFPLEVDEREAMP